MAPNLSFFASTRQRTLTHNENPLDKGLGAAVSFFSPTPSSKSPLPPSPQPPFGAKIHYEAGVRQGTGLHWHETHTEYLRVEHGRLLVWLGDESKVITRDDGDVVIPPFIIHGYQPADSNGADEEVIVWERVDRESFRTNPHYIPFNPSFEERSVLENT